MERGEIPKIVLPCLLISGLVLIPSGCQQRDAQVPANDGQTDFKKVVENQYRKLASGEIRKIGGFANQCSVGMDIEHGIRVSETVCDSKGRFWDVTIRITDPSNRPPSQRQKKINVALGNGRYITVSRGVPHQISNGITMNLDRTGQSVVLNGRVKY